MKRIFSILFILLFSLSLLGCKNDEENKNTNNNELILSNQKISHETKFGGIYIEITIDDFNKLGYSFGDSLNIKFSNGYELSDLPYYNGYYTDTGKPLLVGYPGYPYIRAGINNGDDLFNIAALKETDTATIKLESKAKFLPIQEALDIHYTDIQGDMPDSKFGNFRVVNVGNLKNDILYRSASPVDNQHNRAPVVDRLIKDKVNTIINLSDNSSELKAHTEKEDFNSPYALSLYEKGNIIALSMNMNFKAEKDTDTTPKLYREFTDNTFQGKLIQGLKFMISHDGPYLVHCVEGKDRTGFVCMVIEALASASYNEIINDYMITYDNYYDINLNSEPSKYDVIMNKNIIEMLKTIINDDNVDIKTADYGYYSKRYLMSKGMSEEDINTLVAKITK